jgi:hypothetical protein
MKPTYKDALLIFDRFGYAVVSGTVFTVQNNGKQEKKEKVLQPIRIRGIPARPDFGWTANSDRI